MDFWSVSAKRQMRWQEKCFVHERNGHFYQVPILLTIDLNKSIKIVSEHLDYGSLPYFIWKKHEKPIFIRPSSMHLLFITMILLWCFLCSANVGSGRRKTSNFMCINKIHFSCTCCLFCQLFSEALIRPFPITHTHTHTYSHSFAHAHTHTFACSIHACTFDSLTGCR